MKKRILVAPLNWGLGHATRCIPIINALLERGYEPLLASDGNALNLLKKEFPELTALELPSYNINYAKKGMFFRWKLFTKAFDILQIIKKEHKLVQHLLDEYQINGIISDNRMGMYSKKVPSVFITHQLNVLSGGTTYLSSKIHRYYIKKYDECWIPDVEGSPSLSGRLGHLKKHSKLNLRYIGPLSRFTKEKLPITYDIMAIISGPEPQRTILEDILRKELTKTNKKVLLIRGLVEEKQIKQTEKNITIYNFLSGKELETAFNQSEIIVSRSGYTTLMDISKLGKKAFFIPTPGQFEQVYLAKRLQQKGMVPSCKQHKFRIEKFNEVDYYNGLPFFRAFIAWDDLFRLFKRK